MGLEQAKGAGIDLGEQAQLRQVATHQGEIMLVVQLPQAANPLQRILVAEAATEGIGRVGRIDHHSAGPDDLHGLFDQAQLWVFRMNLEKLTHTNSLFRSQ
ncbi:hypothetical protein D9M68_975600 [compost metagenome]